MSTFYARSTFHSKQPKRKPVKTCNECHRPLPFDAFYKDKRGKPSAYCRKCTAVRAVRWRTANPERHKATVAARRERLPLPPKPPPSPTKTCNGCKRVFPREEFAKRSSLCQVCLRERRKEHRWKFEYGLSAADVAELVAAQGNCCAICGDEFGSQLQLTPHIDHDHATGMVRGLLCRPCNQGLGQFRDDITRLVQAQEYLMANSRFRCKECHQYFPADDVYFANGIAKVCSSECFGTMMGKARATKRQAAGVPAWGRGNSNKTPKVPVETRAQVHARDHALCRCCGAKGTQCHHVVFRSHQGSDELSNLILLCVDCHREKAHGDQSRRYRELFRQYIWLAMVEGRSVFIADLIAPQPALQAAS